MLAKQLKINQKQKQKQKQKGGFLRMLLGSLGTGLLRNLLEGKGTNRAGEDTIRAGQGF